MLNKNIRHREHREHREKHDYFMFLEFGLPLGYARHAGKTITLSL